MDRLHSSPHPKYHQEVEISALALPSRPAVFLWSWESPQMSQSPFAHCLGVTPLVSPLDGEASEQWIPRGELTVQHMLLLHPPAAPAAAVAAASPSPPSTLPEPWSPVPEVPAELVWWEDTSGLLSKEEGAKKKRRERILGRAFLGYTHTHTQTHTHRVLSTGEEFRNCWDEDCKCRAPLLV